MTDTLELIAIDHHESMHNARKPTEKEGLRILERLAALNLTFLDLLKEQARQDAEARRPKYDDFDDVHHALGRPPHGFDVTARNGYMVEPGSAAALRFEMLGWWTLDRFIKDKGGEVVGAVYAVNHYGRQALVAWLKDGKPPLRD